MKSSKLFVQNLLAITLSATLVVSIISIVGLSLYKKPVPDGLNHSLDAALGGVLAFLTSGGGEKEAEKPTSEADDKVNSTIE